MDWFRLCVDIEQDGSVRMCSYERRTDDGPDKIAAGLWHGPFDNPVEAFQATLATCLDREGLQLALFD